jgi:hypothetical protein
MPSANRVHVLTIQNPDTESCNFVDKRNLSPHGPGACIGRKIDASQYSVEHLRLYNPEKQRQNDDIEAELSPNVIRKPTHYAPPGSCSSIVVAETGLDDADSSARPRDFRGCPTTSRATGSLAF